MMAVYCCPLCLLIFMPRTSFDHFIFVWVGWVPMMFTWAVTGVLLGLLEALRSWSKGGVEKQQRRILYASSIGWVFSNALLNVFN